MALGLTQQLPVDETHNYSKEYLDDQIAMLTGGRTAEEIATVGITTGAGKDLERATELARRMVCEWGMSEAVGPLTFGKKESRSSLAWRSLSTRTIVKTRPGGSGGQAHRQRELRARVQDPGRLQGGPGEHRRRAAHA
jgi:ATP-dependent Zn protease